MAEELVLVSSSIEAEISCWDLRTGAEKTRYKTCASPPHGLAPIGGRFLASSQLRQRDSSSSSSGSVYYWSLNSAQVDKRSSPAEPVSPIVSNRDGTFIIGGGLSGNIYYWEVATGKLLKKWRAHLRAITCLVLSDDESLLVSAAEDGSIRIWSLFKVFDDIGNKSAGRLYEHDLSEHTLRVTDVVVGHGGCNARIVSSSEDRTCKVWSLSDGDLLRSIDFPSIINAIALDPFEDVFYAGGKDGKIYIASLTGESNSNSNYGLHILGALLDPSKAVVTCLVCSKNADLLICGLEDGTISIWNTKSQKIVRVLRHAKGHVSNVVIMNIHTSTMLQAGIARRHASLLPSLDRYQHSSEENVTVGPVITLQAPLSDTVNVPYRSHRVMENHIKQLQQEGSSAASAMELKKLQVSYEKALEINEQWNTLHKACVSELLHTRQSDLVDCTPTLTSKKQRKS